ncbi:MAG: hypothetical protein JSW47_11955 [Phycisphaerales bacterium]|nr:MAG: hypothetical protein JSW47_11955 [Phycisphaerales bacterium]
MRSKYRAHPIFEVILLAICLAVLLTGNSWADEDSKYLDAVRTFADNVLKYGRDTYGPKHTPLFVDGLNIHTHEPVKWISPNGKTIYLIFLGRDRFNVHKANLTMSDI